MTTMTGKTTKPADSILTGRRDVDRGLRTRPKRVGLLAFAGLIVAGSALAGAIVFANAGQTVEVLAVRDGIAKGHTITRGNLIAKDISGIDNAILIEDVESVVGMTAVVDILPGQILVDAMASKTPTPANGKATVGLNLSADRAPAAGLLPGDIVDVIAVASEANSANESNALDAPPTLAAGAQVYDVKGSATEGGGVLVTLVVGKGDAARIAAYSAAGRVAIVETSPAGED